jgi:hypothetical protein
MKKIITILLFIANLSLLAQTAYKKQVTYKYFQYTGTRQSYVDATTTLGLDTNVCSCYYNAPTDLIIGSATPAVGEIVYMGDDYIANNRLPSIIHDWAEFYRYYTVGKDSTFTPYLDNTKHFADSTYSANNYVNIASVVTPSLSVPTRSLNTNFTISSTKRARVNYSVRIDYISTLYVGSIGSIILQYSMDAGSTWIDVSTVSNSINYGTAITGYNDYVLHGEIPINALVRLLSNESNTTNTILTKQQELTY